MANVCDYVKWRGDLELKNDEFNEIDGLILSRLSYFPFEQLAEENEEIPKAFQKNNKDESNGKKTKKKKKGLKIFGIIVLILVILFAAIVGAAYIYINDKLGKMNTVQLDESQLGITDEASSKLSKYRNIAIFGVDSREDDYGKGNRSDCIIIASINNETKVTECKLNPVIHRAILNRAVSLAKAIWSSGA